MNRIADDQLFFQNQLFHRHISLSLKSKKYSLLDHQIAKPQNCQLSNCKTFVKVKSPMCFEIRIWQGFAVSDKVLERLKLHSFKKACALTMLIKIFISAKISQFWQHKLLAVRSSIYIVFKLWLQSCKTTNKIVNKGLMLNEFCLLESCLN